MFHTFAAADVKRLTLFGRGGRSHRRRQFLHRRYTGDIRNLRHLATVRSPRQSTDRPGWSRCSAARCLADPVAATHRAGADDPGAMHRRRGPRGWRGKAAREMDRTKMAGPGPAGRESDRGVTASTFRNAGFSAAHQAPRGMLHNGEVLSVVREQRFGFAVDHRLRGSRKIPGVPW